MVQHFEARWKRDVRRQSKSVRQQGKQIFDEAVYCSTASPIEIYFVKVLVYPYSHSSSQDQLLRAATLASRVWH